MLPLEHARQTTLPGFDRTERFLNIQLVWEYVHTHSFFEEVTNWPRVLKRVAELNPCVTRSFELRHVPDLNCRGGLNSRL